jgi:hypothetical protein
MKKAKKNNFLWAIKILLIVTLITPLYKISVAAQDVGETQQDYELVEISEEIGEENLDSAQEREYIAQKQRLAEEIEDLKLQLLSRLNQYERDEKQYRIAIDQYRNLQTLSSIEEAIAVTKRVMLSRNQVLEIYQNLLRLQLIESEGVELSHKRQALLQLEENRALLAEFKNKIEQASDRNDVNVLAVEFTPLGNQIHETSYYALSIMAIGRLQSTYDRAMVINQRVVSAQREKTDQANEAKIKRSLNEIDKLFVQMPPKFESTWIRVSESVDRKGNTSYHSLYQGLTKYLMPIYTDLSKITSYLEEIEQVK